MHTLTARLAGALLPALVCLLLSSGARALTFQADFSGTTYQVAAGDTFADLLAAHLAGTPLASVSMTGFQGVSAQVEAGVSTNYSIMLTTDFTVGVTGSYEFQIGADWGRGGVAAVLDGNGALISELVRTDDIWWANDWNNPDVFTTQLNLDAFSAYTFVWLGFEGCCGGVTTLRFSFEGSPFQTLNTLNFTPFVVPEPRVAALVGLGLVALASRRRSGAR
jgi:hypothetical protein